MCLLCLEIAKSRMTVPEARRALPEMVRATQEPNERQHYEELEKATDEELVKKALEFQKAQPVR